MAAFTSGTRFKISFANLTLESVSLPSRCWFVIDFDECQTVNDIRSKIAATFELEMGDLDLMLDDALLLPSLPSVVIRENDLISLVSRTQKRELEEQETSTNHKRNSKKKKRNRDSTLEIFITNETEKDRPKRSTKDSQNCTPALKTSADSLDSVEKGNTKEKQETIDIGAYEDTSPRPSYPAANESKTSNADQDEVNNKRRSFVIEDDTCTFNEPLIKKRKRVRKRKKDHKPSNTSNVALGANDTIKCELVHEQLSTSYLLKAASKSHIKFTSDDDDETATKSKLYNIEDRQQNRQPEHLSTDPGTDPVHDPDCDPDPTLIKLDHNDGCSSHFSSKIRKSPRFQVFKRRPCTVEYQELSKDEQLSTPVSHRSIIVQNDSLVEKELTDDKSAESGVQTESQIDCCADYSSYPALQGMPRQNDVLAFKMISLGDDYCPTVSKYLEGKVLSMSGTILEIHLTEGSLPKKMKPGKFDMDDESDRDDANPNPNPNPNQQVMTCELTSLIEVKLMTDH